MEGIFIAGSPVIFNSTASAGPLNLVCSVIRELTDAECDREEVGVMYLLRDSSGAEHHAFEDELTAA